MKPKRDQDENKKRPKGNYKETKLKQKRDQNDTKERLRRNHNYTKFKLKKSTKHQNKRAYSIQ